MNNLYNISLTALSPLHMGTGHTLTSVGEFITTNSSVNIIDQQALNQLLENTEGLRHLFLQHIVEKQENSNVFQFFRDKAIDKQIKYTRSLPLHAENFNPESNNLLELHIDTGGGKYVPGSSIKGTLRSIFFAGAILNDPTLKKKVTDIILASRTDLFNIKKKVQELENDLFHDDMEHFKVRDSNLFSDEDICVEVAKRVHLFGVSSEGLDTLRECINIGAETSFELAVDPNFKNPLLTFFNSENAIASMFALINDLITKYIQFESDVLSQSNHASAKSLITELKALQNQVKEGKNERAYLRFGKGKSFYFIVMLPFLDAEARNKVLELMKVEASSVHIFPKTRLLNDANKMFGWVCLEHMKKPVIEIPMFDNKISELVKDTTILTAKYTGDKTVSILINGTQLDNVQLVNKFKQQLTTGDFITVLVAQITKEGKLNQVKLKT